MTAGNRGAPTTRAGLEDPRWLRWTLIGIVVTFLGAFLLLPLAVVFHAAFSQGLAVYTAALTDPVALSAIKLTLVAAGFSLLLNTIFGVAAAWTVTRFRFTGKSLLLTLIDLPFAVSPVIAGLIFVLLFGAQGWAKGAPLAWAWPVLWWGSVLATAGWLVAGGLRLRAGGRPGWFWWSLGALLGAVLVTLNGPVLAWWAALTGTPLAAAQGTGTIAAWLAAGNDLQVIFSTPGIILATAFVTFPFVARELIPVMQSVGQEEEQAALSLGATGWTIFWRITLPNVKWGLLYGLILCNARAMGEFGAVSVVSGHIRGQTNTMPLHIEILFNEYQFAAAFAIASILALLALVTLAAKSAIEWKINRRHTSGAEL
jgi:sulfate transport system permease protein